MNNGQHYLEDMPRSSLRRLSLIKSEIFDHRDTNDTDKILEKLAVENPRTTSCIEMICLIIRDNSDIATRFWKTVINAQIAELFGSVGNTQGNDTQESNNANNVLQQASKYLLFSMEHSQAEKYKQNLLDGLLLFHGVAPCKPLDMDRRDIDTHDERHVKEHTTSYYCDEVTRVLPHLSKMLGILYAFKEAEEAEEKKEKRGQLGKKRQGIKSKAGDEEQKKRLDKKYLNKDLVNKVIKSFERLKQTLISRSNLELRNYEEVCRGLGYIDSIHPGDPLFDEWVLNKKPYEISFDDLAKIALLNNPRSIKNEAMKKEDSILKFGENDKNHVTVPTAIEWLKDPKRKYLDKSHHELIPIINLTEERITLDLLHEI